ncbi:DUF4040 domain-containing protein [Acidaminobacter sp. JC074]|uniref:Na(+)/H(+) antiporter subunit B n=1 Tax=Acidaminobacter sp. JC074 TaxID=2530199 RepID=UPI001F117215|nr:DUF4040 domain-containing protein [Acidaminobacter sp. JC074]
MIKIALMLLLLVITTVIVIEKNNKRVIVYFSVFSLIAASLYFYNDAPDVALAEIAVGSAFIPLIFLITISKQQTFTVMMNTDKEFIYEDLLVEFCKNENLKLKLINAKDVFDDEAKSIHGAFRRQDIDIIVDYNKKKKRYDMTCKESNVMIERFEKMTQKIHGIRIIRTVDEETID